MTAVFWATIGLVGSACVAWMLVEFFRAALKTQRRNRYVNDRPALDERSSIHQFNRIMGRR